MRKDTFSEVDRARIAEGWRASGLSQPVYSAQFGISDRTLRVWISKYVVPRPDSVETVRNALEAALEQLQTMLFRLDSDPPRQEQESQSAPACHSLGAAPPPAKSDLAVAGTF